MPSLNDLNPIQIIPMKKKISAELSFRDDLAFGSGKPDSRANKREVFADNSAPDGSVRVGDLWFDTNDDNKVYRWSGSSWISVQDGGVGTFTGDFDDISDGSTYVKVDSVDSNHNITANSIAANAVTAVKINVSTLSAISADIGTITAGTITGITITGATIQTSASANTGVKMTAAGGLDVYGQTADFRDTSGNLKGYVYGGASGFYLHGYSSDIILIGTTRPSDNNGTSLGTGSYRWSAVCANEWNGTLIPDGDATRTLGSGAKEWSHMYAGFAIVTSQCSCGNLTVTSGLVTSDLNASGAGAYDLGNASNYWGDVSYKTLTDRGCLGWFDDGVELQDGRKVSDIEAIKEIKKHPTKKTIYGVPMMDYKTMPKVSYKLADDKGKILPRNIKDEPYKIAEKDVKGKGGKLIVKKGDKIPAADGVEMTSLFSIMLGAIKELDNKIIALENKN